MIFVTSGAPAAAPDGWVRLDEWTGRRLRRLPLPIREPDEALTHCDSIVAWVKDPACDPSSGGIAGTAPLAVRCGVSIRHFRRNLLPHMPFVRWLADVPVSNVASVDAWAADRRAQVRRAKLARLGVKEE